MAIFKEALQYYYDYYQDNISSSNNKKEANKRFLESISYDYQVQNKQNLTQEDVEDLYFQYIWLSNNYQAILSQKIANLVLSVAITRGIKIANNFLQQTVTLFRKFNVVNHNQVNAEDDEIANIISELNGIDHSLEDSVIEIYKLYQHNHSMNILIHRVNKTKYLKDFILK